MRLTFQKIDARMTLKPFGKGKLPRLKVLMFQTHDEDCDRLCCHLVSSTVVYNINIP